MVKPKTGWVNLTVACNIRCGGCYTVGAILEKAKDGLNRFCVYPPLLFL